MVTQAVRTPEAAQCAASRKLRLNFFQCTALGLYPNRPKGDRRNKEGQRKGMEDVVSQSICEHEADNRGCEERANAADTEEPADGSRTQPRRVELTDIDAGCAIHA